MLYRIGRTSNSYSGMSKSQEQNIKRKIVRLKNEITECRSELFNSKEKNEVSSLQHKISQKTYMVAAYQQQLRMAKRSTDTSLVDKRGLKKVSVTASKKSNKTQKSQINSLSSKIKQLDDLI